MTAAAVVLAAGRGERLGGVAKALLRRHEVTFLEGIAGTLRAVGGGPLVVVVGAPHGEAVAAHARTLTGVGAVAIVANPDPGRGMASSIALGFAALAGADRDPDAEPERVSAAFLWPVDHPAVEAATLVALARALGGHEVARPVSGGRRGHPPLIARRAWDRLARCDQIDGGARAVISTLDVVDVAVDDPGVVRDIDTPADREALR